MNLELSKDLGKSSVFDRVKDYLSGEGLNISTYDFDRPWGGFFAIDEGRTAEFSQLYFPDYSSEKIAQYGGKLSPKILVVEAAKRLSWQYHNRRAELWRTIQGPVGVITSDNDHQGPINQLDTGESIQFDAKIRHRLVGLDNWGIVAEIWQHTDSNNPSNEADVVRLEDDFGR